MEISAEADSELRLTVTDNGTGIRSDVRRGGLDNLSERAILLGGSLDVASADAETGKGSVLDWRVPLRQGTRGVGRSGARGVPADDESAKLVDAQTISG